MIKTALITVEHATCSPTGDPLPVIGNTRYSMCSERRKGAMIHDSSLHRAHNAGRRQGAPTSPPFRPT
ncbi:hypothetical protein RRG08_049077 [Elysia crispata]|uniref:Uncharacterized protein n=1 Tax=Elysia crispata TaxID=231223 RepID=A0AAE1AC47_9GAST|nr:hypothetical protein RRG08_049077 [Elysia crispata]